MTDAPPLTIAELIRLPSDSWVNQGFTGFIESIVPKQGKSGRNFWKCKVMDSRNGSQASMTLFQAPRFKQGDEIEATGQGIKFKNDNYGPEVSVGDKTVIAVKVPEAARQPERVISSLPASPERPQGVSQHGFHPASAGMSVKEALAVHAAVYAQDGPALGAALQDLKWWVAVERTAHRIAVIAQSLETGTKAKIAPQAPSVSAPLPAQAPKPRSDYHPDLEPSTREDLAPQDYPF